MMKTYCDSVNLINIINLP